MLVFAVLEGGSSPHCDKLQINESLISRTAQGDRAAFESLYRQTEPAVYALALSIVRDPDLARDIVQDTFLRVRQSAYLYEPRGKPLAWLFTIAKNLARDALRKAGREDGGADLQEDPRLSYVSDPTDRMVLAAALSILEEQERQTVLLHLVSGLRHREIAQSLGVPLSTALSKYHRALKKLKAYCEREGILA